MKSSSDTLRGGVTVARKKALRMIAYNIFVVTTKRGSEVNAFTGTWLTQSSFEPPLVAIGVNKKNSSYEMIKQSRVFAINFLGRSQKDLAVHFFQPRQRVGNRLGKIPFRLEITGCPILEEASAYLECEVREVVEVGDHGLFIGEVINAGVHREEAPLTLQETGWVYGG